MGAAINKALSNWPAERFPEGFQSYWEHVFSDYLEQTVADAIDAVRMESDPYLPTCEMVRRVLSEWGVVPAARPSGPPAWDRVAYEKVREAGREIERQHEADNAACLQLSPEQFADVAEAVLANMEPDVVALMRRRPLHERQSVRSMVAAHARAHGMLRNRVMESV